VTDSPLDAPVDAPVLVAVINDPDDLLRAQRERWYRIPLAHAPPRMGADFLAFYQTAAFPPDERWAVQWAAAVRRFRLATRRELIPEQPDHPRANERYYRVDLGPLWPLPRPIPSRRLRRITFISTTVGRLLAAEEINDLWVQTPARERLWRAFKQAGLADAVEREYPLLDAGFSSETFNADFAVFGADERLAVIVADDARDLDGCIRERAGYDYPLTRGEWRGLFVDPSGLGWIEAGLRAVREMLSDKPKMHRDEL
jgi:hypothetical protein